MALRGWVLDKNAAVRAGEPAVSKQLSELAGSLFVCPVGELEQLYSARSAHHYEELKAVGVVHVDGDFDRIAEIRPLTSRRLG